MPDSLEGDDGFAAANFDDGHDAPFGIHAADRHTEYNAAVDAEVIVEVDADADAEPAAPYQPAAQADAHAAEPMDADPEPEPEIS